MEGNKIHLNQPPVSFCHVVWRRSTILSHCHGDLRSLVLLRLQEDLWRRLTSHCQQHRTLDFFFFSFFTWFGDARKSYSGDEGLPFDFRHVMQNYWSEVARSSLIMFYDLLSDCQYRWFPSGPFDLHSDLIFSDVDMMTRKLSGVLLSRKVGDIKHIMSCTLCHSNH